ncbi:hypothetical protein I3842_03G044900 [Carya illinoinensis]|uniref:Uncharacterized protein n=1 Tax=Carya illinoinensis TaxID=32201 RepID=A0A922FGI1_CARIL|nr:hypothetical protein I3842_03G044900 [Carya illinoinensis]
MYKSHCMHFMKGHYYTHSELISRKVSNGENHSKNHSFANRILHSSDIIYRWEVWEGKISFGSFHWFINLSSRFSSLKVVRVLRVNPLLVTALTAVILVCLVHPALGLCAVNVQV